jgi:type I site-specific restriction-modification system R (restriction) subunit
LAGTPPWALDITGEHGLAAGIILAVGMGLGYVLKVFLPYLQTRSQERHKAQEDKRKRRTETWKLAYEETIRQLRAMLHDDREHCERLDMAIKQIQKLLALSGKKERNLQAQNAALQNTVYFLYDMLGRHYQALKKLGDDPGDMPKLPDLPEDDDDLEFEYRQVQQEVSQIKELKPKCDAGTPKMTGQGGAGA